MRSWKTPTDDQVNSAVALLVRAEQRRYFFDKLENPEWLRFLAARGFFNSPPEPIHHDEEGTIALPRWPEGNYLARMAVHKPEVVLEVIRKVPETQNVRVHECFIDAALGMPPAIAAGLTKLVVKWVRTPYGLVPAKAGQLMVHLARGGEVKDALRLARALLAVRPNPHREAVTDDGGSGVRIPPEPEAYFRTWDYGEIIRVRVPTLVEAAGEKALRVLEDALNAAVRISRGERNDAKPQDNSFIWRPTIEASSETQRDSVLGHLVDAVRDAAKMIVAADSTRLPAVVETLERREWFIFRRISLYLLAQFPNAAPDLVRARLANRELFDEIGVRHEYAALLRKAFSYLTPEHQATILGWIEQGPDLEQSTGEPLEDAEIAQSVLFWQRDRLSWIGESLPLEWAQRYRDLVDAFGEPKYADLPFFRSGGFVGSTSPRSEEELRAMPAVDVVRFLRRWRPSEDDFLGPSRDGLGQVLRTVVASNPRPYVLIAASFHGLHPTYVRTFLSGLQVALKKGRHFEWQPVLDLCRVVVTSPWDFESGGRDWMDEDRHWDATCHEIVELLSAGLDEGAIPVHLRSPVWDVLAPLTSHPEPTPEYESRYGGSNMDPLNLSINTVRGKAMHAVVRYALWLRRAADRTQGANGSGIQELGFSLMPEVQEVFEQHLDPSVDPSFATRAVYGQWLPWLLVLDAEWTRCNLKAIFPVDPELRHYWDAAWESYIFYSKLFDNVFSDLLEQYSRAVEQIGTTTLDSSRPSDRDQRLGDHLMVMYWRGKLPLDDPGSLLSKFFARAPDQVRGHALAFVGRSIRGDEPLDPVIAERLKALWTHRLAAIKESATPDDHLHELGAFGWWFASGKFDEAWSVPQLLEVLNMGSHLDPDFLVVERLASIGPSMPGEAVECLRLIVEADREGWRIYGWPNEARTILATAMASSDPVVQQSGRDLINWFGARGIHDFRDLLAQIGQSPPTA